MLQAFLIYLILGVACGAIVDTTYRRTGGAATRHMVIPHAPTVAWVIAFWPAAIVLALFFAIWSD